MLKTAIIALGSNLQNPASQVCAALQAVGGHPAIRINKTSSLYVAAPVGYDDQPDFINAVRAVETSLSVEELLAKLNHIETASGRERSFRSASRTLDLDTIDFGGCSSNDPHLTLPHPCAHERGSVMLLLAEILPAFRLGDKGTTTELAVELGGSGVRLLDEGTGRDRARGRLKTARCVFRRFYSVF